MSNSKEPSLADFLAEDELRRVNNERRRKNMKKAIEARRLMRTVLLVVDLQTMDVELDAVESALRKLRLGINVVLLKLRRIVDEQSPAPQRSRTSTKRIDKIEKMRRSLKKYKSKKTQKYAVN